MQSPGSYGAEAFARHMLRITIALVPWGLSLFLHYWLEHTCAWDVQMGGRALISVIMLAIGMALSFVLHAKLSFVTQRSDSPTRRTQTGSTSS